MNHFLSNESFLKLFFKGCRLDINLTQFEFAGSDAFTYLSSQSTHKIIDEIGECSSQTILGVKGKIIAPFSIECIDQDKFLVTLETEYEEAFLKRIEMFHISEDFEILKKSKKNFCYFGKDFLNDTYGKYRNYFQEFRYTDEELNGYELISSEVFKYYFGYLNTKNKFLNETMYSDCSYSESKGCFPGAETVSKLRSGRGAAFFPALIDKVISQDIVIENKTIAKFIHSLDKTSYVELLRDYRIHQFKINNLDTDHTVKLFLNLPNFENLSKEIYEHVLSSYTKDQMSMDEACELLEIVLKLDPGCEDAYEMLGVILGREEKFDDAIKYLEKLEKINPESIMAKTNLSLYHMRLGHIEIAEKYKDESTFLSFKQAGKDFEIKQKDEERIQDLKRREGLFLQVLEIDENDEIALNGIAEIKYDLKEFEEALSYYDKGCQVNQNNPKIIFGLGKTYLALNQETKAKEALEGALKLAAKSGNIAMANEVQSLLAKFA